MSVPFILASGSPRRRELLAYLGIPFEVIPGNAAELTQGKPEELVCANARAKALAVSIHQTDALVLGADTIVCLDDKILGKPRDAEDARQMLRSLSGQWHVVYTGVCLARGEETATCCEATRVLFARMSEQDIEQYVQTGEPMDKAGAYAIQGIGGQFIEKIEGSPSNVIGLPLTLVRRMLQEQKPPVSLEI